MRVPVLLFSVLATSACMGSLTDEMKVPPAPEPPAATVVNGAALELTRPTQSFEGSFGAPSLVWLQAGAATVLDGDAVSQRQGTSFASLLVGTSDDPRTPGTPRAMTVRNGGVFLAGSGGFFHDAPGMLLRSPLSDSFSMDEVRFVDFVDGALWVTTSREVVRVLDGRRVAVSLTDEKEAGALQAVVGRSATRAVVVKGASAYEVVLPVASDDVDGRSITTLARGLPTVTALSRRADVVLLGTSAGLWEVAADGKVTQRTLAAKLSPALEVVDVEATTDAHLVTTKSQVLHVTQAGAVVLADVAAPKANALVEDAAGDVWFLDGAKLARLTTSVTVPPPSFAADVKPFFVAHCTSCHTSGAQYAPVLNFEDYATAKTWAQKSLQRLTDTLAPMPPASAEVLTPAQYDVVVRWIDGGLLP